MDKRLRHALKWADKRKVVRSTEIGHVYLIQSGGFVKVGVADDVKQRIGQLQTGNPVRLKLVAYRLVRGPFDVEREIHHTFKSLSFNGEWFTVDSRMMPSFIAIFNRVCQQYALKSAS